MKWIAFLSTLAVSLCAVPIALAQSSPDVTGTWMMSAVTSRGNENATLVVKKEGDKYVGTITGPDGFALPAQVTLKDNAITVIVSVESSSGARTITLSGTVDGDSMSGTADNSGRGTAPWTAKRAAATANVTGAWALEVATDQGTGTPTFTFKQDGEKLTGQYRGQFGEAPVTGTLKGADITFAVDVTIEGQTGRITYTGTVEKDTMKGSVAFAGLAQGTFKGVRQPS